MTWRTPATRTIPWISTSIAAWRRRKPPASAAHLAEVETHAKELRDRQSDIEGQVTGVPAVSWPDAAAKARYMSAKDRS